MTDEEPKQQRLILVQGKRVGLGALRHDLIPAYLRWRSDPEVMRGTGESSQVPTVEAMQAWYEQATRPGNRDVHFTIYDLDDVAPAHRSINRDGEAPGVTWTAKVTSDVHRLRGRPPWPG